MVGSFFALQGEKRTHHKRKSTMLPQAKAAFCVNPEEKNVEVDMSPNSSDPRHA
jgi:hypothetical protein